MRCVSKSMPSENRSAWRRKTREPSARVYFPVFWTEMSLGTASATTQVAVDDMENCFAP
jgi:hypothetical protein